MSLERATRAGAWSALDIVLRQGVQFVVSIILARLLSPEDFGLMALLTFFTSLSISFVQGGLSMALVQRQDTTLEEESAVFWVNLAASAVFGAFLVLIAPALAEFYEEPMLRLLMFVAAAQVVLAALGAVQTALLTRTLRFDQLTKTGIVSSLISGGLGVACAFSGWGVWALAVQVVAMAGIGSLTLWWVSGWRPVLRFRLSAIRHLMGFGAFVSLSSLLEVLFTNGFALIVGKLYGVRDLGILNRAHGVQALPTGIISTIISRTALPLFAERAADPQALQRAFKRSLSLAVLLTLPVLAGLSVLADLVILILFGEKWMPSAPLLAILALAGMLMPFHVLNVQLVLAQGNSRLFFKLEIWKKVAGIFCLGVGSFYGIYGIAYASLLFSPIAFLINAAPTNRSIGYGAAKQLWDARGVIFTTLLMSCVLLVLKGRTELPPLFELAFLSALGAGVYFAAGFLLKIPSFLEALSMGSLLLKRAPKEARPQEP